MIRRVFGAIAGVSLLCLGAAAQGTLRTWLLVIVTVVVTAAAVARDRVLRHGEVAAQLLIAIAATGVGLAIGIGFARKSGPLPTTAPGFAAVVAGLALLGLLATAFVRAARGWWRLLLAPIVLVVLAAVYVVVPAVVATTPAPTPLGSATPADRGLRYSSVSLAASDGVRLAAWYVPSSNGAAVVAMHGSGSNRTAVLGQAAVLARHGYGVLMLDARGHGSSRGHAMDFGWYGERDIAGAVTWLQQRPDVTAGRIAVLGLSMGGEEAIGAAGVDSRIRAVVAEGVTARTAADKARWLPGGILGAIQRGLDQLTYGLTDALTDAPRPRPLSAAVTRAAGCPMLLIAAGTVADESRAAAALRAASPGNVRVWVVPGAAHTGGLSARPAEWDATVTGFLDAALAIR